MNVFRIVSVAIVGITVSIHICFRILTRRNYCDRILSNETNLRGICHERRENGFVRTRKTIVTVRRGDLLSVDMNIRVRIIIIIIIRNI